MHYKYDSIKSIDGSKLSTIQFISSDDDCLNPNEPAKGLCFFFHGIGSHLQPIHNSRWIKLAQCLSKLNLHCYGMEYKGHGLSDGLPCFINKFEDLVQDSIHYINKIRFGTASANSPCYTHLPCFLVGESMGGAVVIQISRKIRVDGMILLAPMCKIDPSMIPPAPITAILKVMVKWFPQLPIIPASTKFILKCSNNDLDIIHFMYDSIRYNGNHRLKTSVECLNVCDDIQTHLSEITTPFLIIHGLSDTVTDPSFSKYFYDSTTAVDNKYILLLPDVSHSLFTNNDVETIIMDHLTTWLLQFITL